MKNLITTALLCAGFAAHAAEVPTFQQKSDRTYWVTMGQDALDELNTVGGQEFVLQTFQSKGPNGVSIAQIAEGQLSFLSKLMHINHKRCGGYIVHDDLQSALAAQQSASLQTLAGSFSAGPLSQADTVNRVLPNLAKENIVDTISYLSTNFSNRYYTTSGGSGASDGLKARWENIVSGVSWANVTQVSHAGYGQKSVLVTLTGSEKPQDIVVIGGHLDSTIGSTSENSIAPGADDDASGIATLTEVMRVFVEDGIQPKRTVKFYAYAAEEVGLRGSGDIADAHAANGDNVVGVMQLDMTNYPGSVEDIVMMTDYTNAQQNAYIASILDAYLPTINYGYDTCGYGCSDHASWTSAGFPASMPFESRMSQYNPRIHTSSDTLENMDTTGSKALKFAQMALAYVVELSNDTAVVQQPDINETRSNVSISRRGWAHYTQSLDAGYSSLTVTLSGGSGNADLYVRYGAQSTTKKYDCKSAGSTNTETCTINNPQAGTWYIDVRGTKPVSGLTVNWQAQ